MQSAIGSEVEYSLTTGYDYDGHLLRIEVDEAGRPCLVLSGVRKRAYMDDRDRQNGAHEVILLAGERWVPICDVVEFGPCSYPRPS